VDTSVWPDIVFILKNYRIVQLFDFFKIDSSTKSRAKSTNDAAQAALVTSAGKNLCENTASAGEKCTCYAECRTASAHERYSRQNEPRKYEAILT
jgi:hypothetical protein